MYGDVADDRDHVGHGWMEERGGIKGVTRFGKGEKRVYD